MLREATQAEYWLQYVRNTVVLKHTQDRTTDPDGVLAFRRSNKFDLQVPLARYIYKHIPCSRITFMLEGDRAVSSFCMRSEIPGYMVVPPDKTTLPYLMRE